MSAPRKLLVRDRERAVAALAERHGCTKRHAHLLASRAFEHLRYGMAPKAAERLHATHLCRDWGLPAHDAVEAAAPMMRALLASDEAAA